MHEPAAATPPAAAVSHEQAVVSHEPAAVFHERAAVTHEPAVVSHELAVVAQTFTAVCHGATTPMAAERAVPPVPGGDAQRSGVSREVRAGKRKQGGGAIHRPGAGLQLGSSRTSLTEAATTAFSNQRSSCSGSVWARMRSRTVSGTAMPRTRSTDSRLRAASLARPSARP